MNHLTAETARALLEYHPEIGKLFWRKRNRKWFATDRDWNWWNARYSEEEAFTYLDYRGYKQGTILGRIYLAHRVIWLMQTGAWPNYIDHEDGERSNNRWDNLRNVSQQDNLRNQRKRGDGSSIMGIYWNKSSKKWQSQIGVNRKIIYLGQFDCAYGALKARKSAEIQYGFHKNHGRRR